ncbi:serine hydrolase [Actinosynnema sp. CS-041913]|uniref:serine hydrolase n=1 Tax=Actinosynnema sp. CS-041913 TaxID=3239917 RepID=UPI003D8AC6EF
MLLTRRHLLSACGVAGGALLLPSAPAAASTTVQPDDWLGWFRANRRHVAAVVDDGNGGRVAHRPHERQPLASAVKVLHLAGYASAVDRRQVEPGEPVTVGDWEKFYLALDGGAHQQALKALGIKSTNGHTADDPHAKVTLDDLAAVMIRHSDNAAADYLRRRLGDDTMRRAAIRGGWPDAPVPSFLGEWLRLVLNRRVDPERYLADPQLQLEVIGRFPDVPKTYDGQRPWARGTWQGTAAGLHRLHRAMDRFPGAPAHLEQRQDLPAGVAGIGFKGGSLAGVITVGCRVRWHDGRVGTAAVLTEEVDEQRFHTAPALVGLVRQALLDPAALREFQVSLS